MPAFLTEREYQVQKGAEVKARIVRSRKMLPMHIRNILSIRSNFCIMNSGFVKLKAFRLSRLYLLAYNRCNFIRMNAVLQHRIAVADGHGIIL